MWFSELYGKDLCVYMRHYGWQKKKTGAWYVKKRKARCWPWCFDFRWINPIFNCMLCSWHIYEKSCSVHLNVIVTTGGTVLSQMIHLDFGEWHCFVSVYFSSPLPHSMKPRRLSCQDGKETYLSNKICLLDIKKKPDQNQAAMLVSLGSLLTSVLHLRTD